MQVSETINTLGQWGAKQSFEVVKLFLSKQTKEVQKRGTLMLRYEKGLDIKPQSWKSKTKETNE